jgi:glycosyltransferase involved in cell wall biosynthesis
MSLRNLEPIYDVETLIKSVRIVLKKVSKAKFVVVGEGSQEMFLRELAEKLQVSQNICFIGSIPNKEVAKYLASSDIYVSSSLSDAGLAASTAEAMACGVPVIITDFGDNKEWVENGVNGFLFPAKDTNSLAENIIYLIDHEKERTKFGEINQDIINKKLNHLKEMAKMENLYEVLSKRSTR